MSVQSKRTQGVNDISLAGKYRQGKGKPQGGEKEIGSGDFFKAFTSIARL